MDSDSESGSDYEASNDERIAQIKETSSGDAEEGGYTGGGVRSARESLLTEESTVEGLMYASSGEVDHQGTVTGDGTNRITNAATRSSFTDIVEHQQFRSLVPSVVSGKSGTSGPWEGDIYDNYRYSSFSMRSGAGRPSSDSVNGRTFQMSNRVTLTDTGGLQRRSISLDFDDSIYSRDSGLSNLSREFAAIPLPGLDSLTAKCPPLLSIAGHSPLLHTDWASAGSSLSPFAAGVYMLPAGRFDFEVDGHITSC